MPLAGTHGALGTKIANKILDSDAPPELRIKIEKHWQDIAKIIIDHIVQNADVETIVDTVLQGTAGAYPIVGIGRGTGSGRGMLGTGIK